MSALRRTTEELAPLRAEAARLRSEGKSHRQIAAAMGEKVGNVGHLLDYVDSTVDRGGEVDVTPGCAVCHLREVATTSNPRAVHVCLGIPSAAERLGRRGEQVCVRNRTS